MCYVAVAVDNVLYTRRSLPRRLEQWVARQWRYRRNSVQEVGSDCWTGS